MSNLERFKSTVEDFDEEVQKLKTVSEVYQKIEKLAESYNVIRNQFNENSKVLGKINELHNTQQEHVSKSLEELERSNKQWNEDHAKLIDEKIEQLRKENKDFYKDLEGTIKIKLEENKSEIKHLIENERSRIKEIFELEFTKNTREIKQLIESENNKQTLQLISSHRTIKISLWIICGITLVLSLVSVIILTV